MRVGVFMFATPHTAAPADVARQAEALGFESFWLPEHPVVPVHYDTRYSLAEDGMIPEHFVHLCDPFISLASAAAVTKTIKLATGICLVPQRHPLVLAKAVATLDHYANGRVIFGVGAGWFREEAALFGVDFSRRWVRLRESVEAMRALWTQEAAEYHGEYVDFPPVQCLPQPVQKPHPPVLLGTYTYGEPSLRRVAAWADGWCPPAYSPQLLQERLGKLHALTEAAGRDPSKLEITVLLGVTLGRPCVDLIKQYEDAGAHRVVLMLGQRDGVTAALNPYLLLPHGAEAALEQLADQSLVRL